MKTILILSILLFLGGCVTPVVQPEKPVEPLKKKAVQKTKETPHISKKIEKKAAIKSTAPRKAHKVIKKSVPKKVHLSAQSDKKSTSAQMLREQKSPIPIKKSVTLLREDLLIEVVTPPKQTPVKREEIVQSDKTLLPKIIPELPLKKETAPHIEVTQEEKITQKEAPLIKKMPRYLISIDHYASSEFLAALKLSKDQQINVHSAAEALAFEITSTDTTLYYLSSIKSLMQLSPLSQISHHLAKKSFWFVTYKEESDLQSFQEKKFNGIKTMILFIPQKALADHLKKIAEVVSSAQLLQAVCEDEKECKTLTQGNRFLVY